MAKDEFDLPAYIFKMDHKPSGVVRYYKVSEGGEIEVRSPDNTKLEVDYEVGKNAFELVQSVFAIMSKALPEEDATFAISSAILKAYNNHPGVEVARWQYQEV